ncbi:1-deoxy-D-xylulose 5-phosphate reductoisomerase [Desulfitobacterium dichloroeliminans LMG P-21439]|uniref:1-deoxy-D-xylulose 5-phosphate reductoisomerase n=1 Tax=Desulfitobacterium dichloroeliminans (strain LMG P-21439 / DCA1) TaxID=871963 RepID=L0FBJ6_DESDL|nr:1-deoxy-D-xylulose-5-phosphate reductoisomerase [Desulfitobacterium dichloroeliminans]AGA70006.1 1-deoxy-D-xylulose 5-phosphate reductoisomerase [Desulfitobacterium dichloroeliminans LMG P-21439]
MKRLTILGSTGSIGTQTLDIVRQNPGKFEVYALAAGRNAEEVERQARQFKPRVIGLMDDKAARELKQRVADLDVEVVQGMEGLLRSVTDEAPDTIVTAISGRIGLEPTLAALQAGKDIALANKETLVAGGELVMETAKKLKRRILPVDSEHSAIFQCLEEDERTLEKIILTASGGPFRGWSAEKLKEVTPEVALKHPNWAMGAKITIDSATMMNKGLEVIEAHHLFNMTYEQIEVLIHPQSAIHSMVQYCDGSVLAQLGRPDMHLPIQYALSYPTRWSNPFERLDLRGKTLTFFDPDEYDFPALKLAYACGRRGGTLPAVMNAANEVAVHAFLARRIPYLEIIRLVERVCTEHDVLDATDLETILSADHWARMRTEEFIG